MSITKVVIDASRNDEARDAIIGLDSSRIFDQLYGLTDKEIAIIENKAGKLIPRSK